MRSFRGGVRAHDVLRQFCVVYILGISVLIIPISKVVFPIVTLLKFILKNCYSRSRSSRSDNSNRPNAVGNSICDQYWTIPDIWPILLQAAVRAPVILLVVYDLGALGANNRGVYFAPTSLTGMLLRRIVEGLQACCTVAQLCHQK